MGKNNKRNNEIKPEVQETPESEVQSSEPETSDTATPDQASGGSDPKADEALEGKYNALLKRINEIVPGSGHSASKFCDDFAADNGLVFQGFDPVLHRPLFIERK